MLWFFNSWEKQEGDKIEEGDSIAMIETDKASMEMEILEEGMSFRLLLFSGTLSFLKSVFLLKSSTRNER